MIRSLTGIWLVSLLVCLAVSAGADVPDKAKDAVRDFALKHNKDWEGGQVVVTIRGGEKLFDKYSSDKMDFIVPSDYNITRMTANAFVPIAAVSEGEELARMIVSARIEVYKDVVVAAERMLKGEKVGEAKLTIKPQDVSMYNAKYYLANEDVAGKITRTIIQKGTVVLDWMVKNEPLIAKGDQVRILVKGENLLIESTGIALSDGQADETISVRREDSREVIPAKVVSSDSVEVKI